MTEPANELPCKVTLRLYLLHDGAKVWLFSTTGFREPPAKLAWVAKSKPVTVKSHRHKLKTVVMDRDLAESLDLMSALVPKQRTCKDYMRPTHHETRVV